jgi:DNA-binding NtrC family response regulator
MSTLIVRRILDRFSSILRRVQESGRPERVLLVVSRSHSLHLAMRVAAVEAQWHVIHARSLEHALEIVCAERVWVVLYDADPRQPSWVAALKATRAYARSLPAFVVMTESAGPRAWEMVIEHGGFDVLPTPCTAEHACEVVNAAMALSASMETAAAAADQQAAGR